MGFVKTEVPMTVKRLLNVQYVCTDINVTVRLYVGNIRALFIVGAWGAQAPPVFLDLHTLQILHSELLRETMHSLAIWAFY